MKKFLTTLIILLIFCISIFAQVNSSHVKVKGYYRKDGTYVQPHYRTAPNSTNRDNFSTKGNINPYTGKAGWVKPDNNVNYSSSSSHGSYRINYNSNKANGICKSSKCINKSLTKTNGYQTYTTSFCKSHTPICENPSCSNHSSINYNGIYQKYCSSHTHTCKSSNCYNLALKDNSGFSSYTKYTNYCSNHTPRCQNPNCSDYASTSYSGGYQKYCTSHIHTCKSSNCYNLALKDNSGYSSFTKYTDYCENHTPKCAYPNCSNFASTNYYGGYQKYCRTHK